MRPILGATLVALIGCGNGAQQSMELPIAQCLVGWYLQPPQVPCSIVVECKTSPMPPECQQSDCVQWGFIGFVGSSYYEGTFTYSAQGKSMSGSASISPYQQTADGYRIGTSPTTGGVVVMSCTSSEMTNNMDTVMRPPDNLSAALTTATTNQAESWMGVTVSP